MYLDVNADLLCYKGEEKFPSLEVDMQVAHESSALLVLKDILLQRVSTGSIDKTYQTM